MNQSLLDGSYYTYYSTLFLDIIFFFLNQFLFNIIEIACDIS